ncbi:DUF4362 domain-containing protein [Bacillus spongiae]|uniref:DUF4362 domain-containing protein n=1 Tax=Bacillus spongiae TaxID=2683610 RepID=A0ABU8HHW5_9BACI
MRSVTIGIIFIMLFITGCQTNNEEVVNTHGEIENLKRLNSFIQSVENQSNDVIDYVRYGIEGQRGLMTLTFDGEQVNVSYSVDGNFIEKFSCKKIEIEKGNEMKKYILVQCSGNFNGDLELLSVPNK